MSDKERKPDAEEPERYTALYDPDTVFPARMADKSWRARQSTGDGGSQEDVDQPALYSESEKRRSVTPMSEDVVKAIADRIERRAKRGRRP